MAAIRVVTRRRGGCTGRSESVARVDSRRIEGIARLRHWVVNYVSRIRVMGEPNAANEEAVQPTAAILRSLANLSTRTEKGFTTIGLLLSSAVCRRCL